MFIRRQPSHAADVRPMHDRRREASARRATQRGYTAIELILTVATIAVLAAVALPGYQEYVRRSRLTDAFEAMTQFRTRMEQAYQDNGNYGIAGGACAIALPAATPYFTYACMLGANGASFMMTGTGFGIMNGYVYALDGVGNRRTTAFPRATVPVACWLTRPAEC